MAHRGTAAAPGRLPMLVVSRKIHEEIVIGPDVTITIVAVRGKQVRIGIKAAPDVSIRREELEPLPRSEASRQEAMAQQCRRPCCDRSSPGFRLTERRTA